MRRINDYQCTNESCGAVKEFYWDVDAVPPCCSECEHPTERMIGAPRISYAGAKTFRQRVPTGFKDVLKNLDRSVPEHFKAGKMSAL